MKKIILLGLVLLTGAFANAQTDVSLKINHKLGFDDFTLGAVGTNNLGYDFKATRLQYYLSQVTIIHDGGTETAVPLEVLALVEPQEEISTTIELGSFDVITIESVRFYIGVQEPENNADPTLWPEDHPLAPKSPEMQWGWAAGYRFVAYEGESGSGFDSFFGVHALGNDNYFEVATNVEVEAVGEALVMNVMGDYSQGLNDLILNTDILSHGATGAALQVLENWRDDVFGIFYSGLPPAYEAPIWNVYPNPSTEKVTVTFAKIMEVDHITITNLLGEIVQTVQVTSDAKIELTIQDAGIYFINAMSIDDQLFVSEKLVIE
ncbi:MAG: T9SS type A sorting domain-containing protein [Crocinitomix sp.]|nr:T9SS type A sorting domain-containing protein [Crocinitomix sp.]